MFLLWYGCRLKVRRWCLYGLLFWVRRCSGHGGSCRYPKELQSPIIRTESQSDPTHASTLTFVLDNQNGRGSTGISGEMSQVGCEDEDYFAHFGDLEFTVEDLARIDCIYRGEFPVPVPALPLSETKAQARVVIEVEQELQPVPEAVSPPPAPPPHSPAPEPPYDAFRSGKSLSVSDLTGPLWCVNIKEPNLSAKRHFVGVNYNTSIGNDKAGVSKLRTARRSLFPERGIR